MVWWLISYKKMHGVTQINIFVFSTNFVRNFLFLIKIIDIHSRCLQKGNSVIWSYFNQNLKISTNCSGTYKYEIFGNNHAYRDTVITGALLFPNGRDLKVYCSDTSWNEVKLDTARCLLLCDWRVCVTVLWLRSLTVAGSHGRGDKLVDWLTVPAVSPCTFIPAFFVFLTHADIYIVPLNPTHFLTNATFHIHIGQ